jgi:hypothetical protein
MSGILDDISNIKDASDATIIGNAALESEIVLSAIRNECKSDEEFAKLMEDYATEMALYGVIENADIATEAAKRIVIKDYKTANFNKIARRTAIRMAMVNNDVLYEKYKKYRELLISTRDKIYKKYASKARVETKKIIANARKKAVNMPTAGKSITEKIDKQISNIENDNK